MSTLSGYKTKAFSPTQKFFVLDPNTGSPAFVQGSDLIALAKNFVYSESTRDTAATTDYPVGAFVQTAGETSAGDNFGATYLVVPAGEGNFPMDNGNELLVIQGDEFLREQLVQPVATYNSVSQMVSDPNLTANRKARTLGYYTPGDGGGNDYEIVAGATGTADGGSFIDLDNGLQAKGLFSGGVIDKQFGVVRDGSTVTTLALQNAFNYSASSGKPLGLSSGTAVIGRSGSQILGRDYGLVIPSGLTAIGPGIYASTIKADANSDMDVITSVRTEFTDKIKLHGFGVDGNSINQTVTTPDQTAAGFNYWLFKINDLQIGDLLSKDTGAFGFRIEQVDRMIGGSLVCDHRADENADGVHFIDSSNVVIDKIFIKTEGDDGFNITTENGDSHDFAIGEIIVTAPVFIAAGRGIRLANSISNVDAGVQRKIYNINISSAITYNCDSSAVAIEYADFYNININHTDYGSLFGMTMIHGWNSGTGVVGSMRGVNIKTTLHNPQRDGIQTFVQNGTMEFCKIEATIINPGDGYQGATLYGSNCEFHVSVDYDPEGTKTNKLEAVRSFPNEPFEGNTIFVTAKGADTGIQLNPGADNNTVHIGALEGNSSYDVDLNGCAGTKLIGGKVSSIRSTGTDTRSEGVTGLNNRGKSTVTVDANGEGLIPHGLVTPLGLLTGVQYAQVDFFGGNPRVANPMSADTTDLRIKVRNFDGTFAAAGDYVVMWEVGVF